MKRRPKDPLGSLVIGVFAGWFALLIALASYGFLLARDSNFAPELGLSGSFMVFGAIFSVFYFADVALITIPCFLFQKGLGRIRAWQRAIYGGVLFGLSAVVWDFVCGHGRDADTCFVTVLGFISGFASFYVLTPYIRGGAKSGGR